ncbi:MAG: hypothetical protein Q7U38_00530 [Methylobacter sp.]|nr:hypothetical protein [Methylobacter sp.]MDP2099433.1 hypothetical protein [Methylobacter sp.]MDP2429338.1 hypothetical protein [Methylobacter sp.]MDP3055049.1 hypothetical protein [Methylobacter sp.]MDP3361814.1 hypothetical protein [Methylobacter sp.]
MKNIILIAIALLMTSPIRAEVFKCKVGENKIIYQPAPCSNDAESTAIEIKRRSAEKEAVAIAALNQWKETYEKNEALKIARIKEARAQQLREAEVRATERNAIAQQGQWNAEHRQARAMEEGKVGNNFITIGR